MSTSTYLTSVEKAAQVKKIVEEALQNEAVANSEIAALLHSLLNNVESDQEHIVRGMELPSTYRMAGLSLLLFFTRLVELEHPHIKVKSITEQKDEWVKLILEVESKHRQTVENLLEHYSQALLRKKALNSVAKSDRALMELKKALDVSALEISLTKGIETEGLEEVSSHIESFGAEVEQLHQNVGRGLSNMSALQHVIISLLSEEREAINKALLTLRDRLHLKMSAEDVEEIKAALLMVREHAPDTFEELRQIINKTSVSGAAGDMLYSWLASLSGVMPK